MRIALLVAAALALGGCLRVGPGEDLQFVCEEKSGSPRMAYGIDFLVAQIRVNGTLSDSERLQILEAARHHVITFAGREHVGFEATLAPLVEGVEDQWRFTATGIWDTAEPDRYVVPIVLADGAARAPPLVDAPRSIRDVGWRAVNESPQAAPDDAPPERATWDPALPSCVTMEFGTRSLVVNVVQGRVVLSGD